MHNLWSKTPDPVVHGSGDIVGNPLLSAPLHSIETGIDPHWYQLTSLSPAIGHANPISTMTVDYFLKLRGLTPDIGFFESATN